MGVFRGRSPQKGVWGSSPDSKSPQEWGIQGADEDFFGTLLRGAILISYLAKNKCEWNYLAENCN